MEQVHLKVYVTYFPYFIYGIDESGNTYTFIDNAIWIKLDSTSKPLIMDDLKLIDENVFYVQS